MSIRQFVGAMLEQITRARVTADAASVRIAHHYRQHDILKGFSVPCMHVREVELELTFAVAPGWKPVALFADENVRLNAVNQLEHFVEQLPAHPELKPSFERIAGLKERWSASFPALRGRFDRTLADTADGPMLVPALVLLIENYFYGVARELLSAITPSRTAPGNASPHPVLRQYIVDGVSGIVASLHDVVTGGGERPDEPDIGVLFGSDELGMISPDRLQKMKITVAANDRKWIVSDADGEQIHTLTR